jgi:hypothetical protein
MEVVSEPRVQEIFTAAADHLQTAWLGLAAMKEVPGGAQRGLHNAVVFGRMVTFALQNLRGKADGFGPWYEAKEAEMRRDPLLVYFKDLRTKIEKQAHTPTARHVGVSTLNRSALGPPPPGATEFFLGDRHGGSGWRIPAPDGTLESYYVTLPESVASVQLVLTDIPREVRGERTTVQLVEAYLDKMSALLTEAQRLFGLPAR